MFSVEKNEICLDKVLPKTFLTQQNRTFVKRKRLFCRQKNESLLAGGAVLPSFAFAIFARPRGCEAVKIWRYIGLARYIFFHSPPEILNI